MCLLTQLDFVFLNRTWKHLFYSKTHEIMFTMVETFSVYSILECATIRPVGNGTIYYLKMHSFQQRNHEVT
jgi:hypothetical protein